MLGPSGHRPSHEFDRWLTHAVTTATGEARNAQLRAWSAARGEPDPQAVWIAPADLLAVQTDAAGERVVAACADGSVWHWTPARGTPPQIVARIAADVTRVVRVPATAERLQTLGVEPAEANVMRRPPRRPDDAMPLE